MFVYITTDTRLLVSTARTFQYIQLGVWLTLLYRGRRLNLPAQQVKGARVEGTVPRVKINGCKIHIPAPFEHCICIEECYKKLGNKFWFVLQDRNTRRTPDLVNPWTVLFLSLLCPLYSFKQPAYIILPSASMVKQSRNLSTYSTQLSEGLWRRIRE